MSYADRVPYSLALRQKQEGCSTVGRPDGRVSRVLPLGLRRLSFASVNVNFVYHRLGGRL